VLEIDKQRIPDDEVLAAASGKATVVVTSQQPTGWPKIMAHCCTPYNFIKY